MDIAEIIKQGRRMCKAHRGCKGCPFDEGDGSCNPLINNRDIENFCDVILHWSTSHPEPRYPTWAEWWATLPEGTYAIIIHGVFLRFGENKMYTRNALGETRIFSATDQIQPDVAERLGIKPVTKAKE